MNIPNERTKFLVEHLWALVRGDLPAKEFEIIFYHYLIDIQKLIPSEIYDTLYYFNYNINSEYPLRRLRDDIFSWLEKTFSRECECITWRNGTILGLLPIDKIAKLQGNRVTYDFFETTFKLIQKRTPTIQACTCRICDTNWYIGFNFHYDEYELWRITSIQINDILNFNKWPNYFDSKNAFWPEL